MSRPKLLLADDSLTIQKLINLTFADEGFDVITVGDGDSALRQINEVRPDVVLADVHMPGPNGYEICSMLRGIDETADLPVMLLVGSFEPFDPEAAERVGASGFATKPFQSIRQLVDQVRVLLGPGEQIVEPEAEAKEDDLPDTSDIDSLYEQSFAETVEMPPEVAAQMAAAAYASDNLDDGMIETSYSAEQAGEPVEFDVAIEETADFDDFVVHDPTDFISPSEPATEIVEELEQPAYDELPAAETMPSEAVMSVAAMAAAPTEEFQHDGRDPFASKANEFDLDEIDLLDLTPATMSQPMEFTTPAAAAEQGSKSQVVSLSPELLDIIVQKVVEKLSEKY